MAVEGQQLKALRFQNTASKCSMTNLITGKERGREAESGNQIPKDLGVGEGAGLFRLLKCSRLGKKQSYQVSVFSTCCSETKRKNDIFTQRPFC